MSTLSDKHDPEALARRGFALQHDSFGRLVLIDAEGRRHVDVEPVRGYPLSDAEAWITVCDGNGRELLCIERLSDLAAPLRQTILEELARREFVPTIQRIVRVSSAAEPSEWTVETDRGPTTLYLNGEEDVRAMSGGRVMIVDDQGIRYLIADLARMDAASRKILERYV